MMLLLHKTKIKAESWGRVKGTDYILSKMGKVPNSGQWMPSTV